MIATGGHYFPGLDVGIPASVVFAAFDIDGDLQFLSLTDAELIDLVAPGHEAQLFREFAREFEYVFLFAPGTPGRLA